MYVWIVWCTYRYKGCWVREVQGIFRHRVAAEMWATKFQQERAETDDDWAGGFSIEMFPVSSFDNWRHPAYHGYGDDDDY